MRFEIETASELRWQFGDHEPSLVYGDESKWGLSRTIKVDPFPAYRHSEAVARSCVERLVAKWPLGRELFVWCFEYEPTSRTNGFSDRLFEYSRSDGERKPPKHHIALAGKRIPLHPAMTRYLVAHEYGHHVEWVLAAEMYPDEKYPFGGGGRDSELISDYAQLRGLESVPYSRGGTWHRCPTEVFANDFRVLIAEEEVEFWPHAVPRPDDVPEVVRWWEHAHHDLTALRQVS